MATSNYSLLLHFKGFDTSNVFLDSSPTTKAITAAGNAQIKNVTGPFGDTTGVAYFDGSGDYLSTPNNAAFDLGTGDFTISLWVNPDAAFTFYQNQISLIMAGAQNTASNYGGWNFHLFDVGTGQARLEKDLTTGTTVVYSWSDIGLTKGAWNHVVLVRSGGTTTFYLNGASKGDTATFNGVALPVPNSLGVYIGSGGGTLPPTLWPFKGYMDEILIVKGEALYSGASFTVPTAPYDDPVRTVDSSKYALLLHCEGVNNSVALVDNSPNPKGFTVGGNAKISSTQAKFGSTALAFDGSGDYFRIAAHGDFAFSTGDFTISLWVYMTADPTTDAQLFDFRTASAQNGMFYIEGTNQRLTYYNGTTYGATGSSVPLNTWTHIAFAKVSGTLTAYLNGVPQWNTSAATDFGTAARQATIGANYANTNGFTGYFDEILISKGEAIYTADFSASLPSAPYSDAAASVVDTNFSSVSLLLPMNGADSGTVFNDRSINRKTITRSAALTSFAQNKFGGSSGYFNGSSRLTVTNTSELQFGSGDFTIEGWFFLTSVAAVQIILEKRTAATARGIVIYNNTGGAFTFAVGDTDTASWNISQASATISANTWYHFAFKREGTVYTSYLNSTQVGTTDWAGTIADDTSSIYIGQNVGATGGMTGYLQDIRITTGVARTITVPTAQYWAGLATETDNYFSNVKLLINGDGAQGGLPVDKSLVPKIVSANVATISRADSKVGPSAIAFNGSSTYLSVADSADWDFGTGDFSIEGWFDFTAHTSNTTLLCHYLNSTVGWSFQWRTTNVIAFGVGDTQLISGSFTPTNGVWYHIAVSRTSGTLRLWVNGAQIGTDVANATDFTGSTNALLVGALFFSTYQQFFNGYAQGIRVTKGSGRYSAAFTAPNYLLDTVGAETYTLTIPSSILIFDDYDLTVPISIEMLDRYTLTVPTSILIFDDYSLTVPISIDMIDTYTVTAPISLLVFDDYTLTAPVSLQVYYRLVAPVSFNVFPTFSLSAPINYQVVPTIITIGGGAGAINTSVINSGGINSSGQQYAELLRYSIPISISLAIQLKAPISIQMLSMQQRLTVPLYIKTYLTHSLSVPISVQVREAQFDLAAPLSIRTYETFQLRCYCNLQVYPAFASGTGGQGVGLVVQPPSNHAQRWTLKVLLNDVDVSARLTGELNVDAEENSARIATFSLRPANGLVDPYSWVKASVKIYYVSKTSAGVVQNSILIFQGIVDTPIYDTTSRVTEFTCTDNLQNYVMAMTHAQVDTLTPLAKWSKFVFDETADSWAYLQDRLSTYHYAVGLDLNQRLVAYDNQAGAIKYEFNQSVVVDGSLSVTLANAREIVNQCSVSLTSQYDQPRETIVNMRWEDTYWLDNILMPNWWLCLAQMIPDAVSGAGASFVVPPLVQVTPPSMQRGRLQHWNQMNYGNELDAISVQCAFSKRFMQSVQQDSTVLVQDTKSISQLGVLSSEESASISVEYQDGVAEAFTTPKTMSKFLCSASNGWQSPRDSAVSTGDDPLLFVSDGSGGAWIRYPSLPFNFPMWDETDTVLEDIGEHRYKLNSNGTLSAADSSFNSAGRVSSGEYAYKFDDFTLAGTEAERSAALQVLIAKAKQQVLSSHRQNRVGFSTHINPLLDRGQTLRLNTPTLIASGIAYQVSHVFSIEAGTAMTNITLAVSSSKAIGITDVTYNNILLRVPLSIEIYDGTIQNNLPVNQSSISYDLLLETDYTGTGLSDYVFSGTQWGGFFTKTYESGNHEFVIEFPTLASDNTSNATITTELTPIEAAVPNDELILMA